MTLSTGVLLAAVATFVACTGAPVGRVLRRWAGRWWWVDLGAVTVGYAVGGAWVPAAWLFTSGPGEVDPGDPWFTFAGLLGAMAGGIAVIGAARGAGIPVGAERVPGRLLGVGAGVGVLAAGLSLGLSLVAEGVGEGISLQDVPAAVAVTTLPGWARILTVGVTLVGAPLVEEAVFRGVVFGVLARRFGAPVALTATAAAFGLSHGLGVVVLASTLLYGVLWGYLRARTGSIWPGVVAHVVTNTLALASATA